MFLSDPARDDLPKTEMAKLWKGIFYCVCLCSNSIRCFTERKSDIGFWMSDKPLVQQSLATEIAEIILSIPRTPSSLAFLNGFWEAIVREWAGIDRLRCVRYKFRSTRSSLFCSSIDKYYMLVRRFVNASFRLLVRAGWDSATCREYNSILTNQGGPLW